MAPEQFQSEPITPATDLYAVGCTAYTMLAGRPPFQGHIGQLVLAHLHSEAPLIEEQASIPVPFAQWIRRLMRKSAAERFQTAEEALEALRAWSGDDTAPLSNPSPPSIPHEAGLIGASVLAHPVQSLSRPRGAWSQERFPNQPLAHPLHIGDIVLDRVLAQGATARVWLGHHLTEHVPVALKVLGSHVGQRNLQLQRELQAIARLNHPNIVVLYDSGDVPEGTTALSRGALPDQAPYLVMEYAPEGSLWDAMTSSPARRPSSWAEVRALLIGLLKGLAHAHARGVLHLDLKPQNALLWARPPSESTIKLGDFGLARSRDEGDEGAELATPVAEEPMGTPRYMAPEQFMDQRRDFGPWTDLYALGVIAWELVCGAPPFGGPRIAEYAAQHVTHALPKPQFVLEVPQGLESWLRRVLAKAPHQRFPFARDAAWALEHLDTATPPVERSMPLLTEPSNAEQAPVVPAGQGLYPLRQRPLVGRWTHRTRLWQALAAVRDTGQVQVVVLEGPSGYGKSRLARWLVELAHEEAIAHTLTARHGAAPGMAGLRRMLASHLGSLGLSGEALVQRLKRLWTERQLGEHDTWQPLAALLMGDSPRGSGIRPIRFANDAERFHLITTVLQRLGRHRPCVVWLDDVQWSAESIALVRHCTALAPKAQPPVLFVLTVNTDALEHHPAEREALELLMSHQPPGEQVMAERLTVGPLSEGESEVLVRQLLKLSPEWVHDVVLQMRGNPLFAVRLVEDWVQRQLLEPGDDGLRIASSTTAALPEDLHQLWSQAVERLLEAHPRALPVLELAAALGHEFAESELTLACIEAGLELTSEVLVLLQRRGLLVATEQGWAFSHAMFRDSLMRLARRGGRWADFNAACARMLDHAQPQGSEQVRLARYLMHAERYDEALTPLMASIHTYLDTSAFQRAEALLQTYDEAIGHLGLPDDDPRTLEGWLAWAQLYRLNW